MTVQQLATKIAYGQCMVKPEGVSFARWNAMVTFASRWLAEQN